MMDMWLDSRILSFCLSVRASVSVCICKQPNPDNKPGPDFIAMNKLAADENIITSKDQITFRKDNFKTLKTGKDKEGQLKKAISLPSQSDPTHTYGR